MRRSAPSSGSLVASVHAGGRPTTVDPQANITPPGVRPARAPALPGAVRHDEASHRLFDVPVRLARGGRRRLRRGLDAPGLGSALVPRPARPVGWRIDERGAGAALRRDRASPAAIAVLRPDPAPTPDVPERRPLPTVRLASAEFARQVGIETAPAGEEMHAHRLTANAETAYDAQALRDDQPARRRVPPRGPGRPRPGACAVAMFWRSSTRPRSARPKAQYLTARRRGHAGAGHLRADRVAGAAPGRWPPGASWRR